MSSEVKRLKAPKGLYLTTDTEGTIVELCVNPAEFVDTPPTLDDLKAVLAANGIVYGLDENAVATALNTTEVKSGIVLARGIAAIPGEDARIELLFELRKVREPSVDARGRIDYKNLDFIQNARIDQVLARKTAATPGTPGTSVFGTPITPKQGRDRQLGKGAGTRISDDGLNLLATMEGTIAYKFGTVSVHPNENIPSSVDTRTGNIDCVGSIKIGKDISSDFKVIAGHDIEVGGNVEDAHVQAGGNITVKGGFFGGGKGKLVAAADVTVKYVENQRIRAGGIVTIGGEALNADIYSDDSVLVQGKPGSIIGGTVAAKRLVRAMVIGNEASVASHVHVAYDMKTVNRLREIGKELDRLQADEKRIKDAMVMLYKLEMDGKLPADKKQALDQFKAFIKDMPSLIEDLKREQEELKKKLQEMTGARIVVEQRAYAGTVLHFGTIYRELLDDEKGPLVFEKVGDTITRSVLDPNRERQLEEEWRRIKLSKIDTEEVHPNSEQTSLEPPQPVATTA